MDKLNTDKLKNFPTNLIALKSKVDQIDVDKLVTVPVDLRYLLKNDVIKKDVYNAKIKNIEDKIPDLTNLATNAFLNSKVNEVKSEIRSINNSATNGSFNANINEVKVEIPNITKLAATTAVIAVEKK